MAKNHSTDRAKRSLAKSITYRVLIIIADAVITYSISHRYDITIGFVIFTNIASTAIFYLHERAWSRISWGRNGR